MFLDNVLVLPGLSSSGPTHWQTIWEKEHAHWTRVEQSDWFCPEPSRWVQTIQSYVEACKTPPLLVAHSLACVATVLWAQAHSSPIRGAFLVAPADVESQNPHRALLQHFAPIPRNPLPFPCQVVASSNDPYASLERVQGLAKDWGATCMEVGALGHINAESNLGSWDQGMQLLQAFALSIGG